MALFGFLARGDLKPHYYSCSVTKLCLILCDPMDCRTPGFPVLHYIPNVCSNSCPLCRWCHPTISSSVTPFWLQPFPSSGSFPVSWFFASGGCSIGASASASVLPMNIQGWFLLALTVLISLLSKGLSRVFSSITILKASILQHLTFFTVQLSYMYVTTRHLE